MARGIIVPFKSIGTCCFSCVTLLTFLMSLAALVVGVLAFVRHDDDSPLHRMCVKQCVVESVPTPYETYSVSSIDDCHKICIEKGYSFSQYNEWYDLKGKWCGCYDNSNVYTDPTLWYGDETRGCHICQLSSL